MRLRACDPGGPGFNGTPSNYVVSVVFTPQSGTRNVVVLANDCTGIGSCAGAASTTCFTAGPGTGLDVVDVDNEQRLRFIFPNTDSLLQGASDQRTFSGPATIAVKDISITGAAQAPACELVTQTCTGSLAVSGLVSCIDDYFANDGGCGRGTPQGTFNHFTALPPPNNFQQACFGDVPPCNPGSNPEFRGTTDKDGNVLIPMDWRGILVPSSIPEPRTLRTTLAPLVPLRIPGPSFVGSFTPEGGGLDPVFVPLVNPLSPSTALTLFGTSDAPYTILRLARRSSLFLECAGGSNDGLPCNGAADCPNGACGPTTCSNGPKVGQACNSDANCGGGECGASTCFLGANGGDPCHGAGDCASGICLPGLFEVRALGVAGVGPLVIPRTGGAGVCQADVDIMCPAMSCGGNGPCVEYALQAQNPVAFESLKTGSDDMFAFTVNEGSDLVDRNGDGDSTDAVITLRDKTTGASQPLGAPDGFAVGGAALPRCGIPASPVPEGRSVVRAGEPPFRFSAVATEGSQLAFLEQESTENACDENGDYDRADAILRVFQLGGNERTAGLTPARAVDAAALINDRSLALNNGKVFYRRSEALLTRRLTERVSLDSTGAELFSSQHGTALSDDCRYVAFHTDAAAVPNDNNNATDVFVHDRQTNNTIRVSVQTGGAQSGSGDGGEAISADGSVVVFYSGASDLVPGDTNAKVDVFVHNIPSNTTQRVSVSTAGIEGDADSPTVGLTPVISADGRFVAFTSDATNLVAGDTNGQPDVFVRDLVMNATERVNVSSSNAEANSAGNNDVAPGGISADGRFVVFTSGASNLVPGDNNGVVDVFVRDRLNGTTELVDVAMTGGSAMSGSVQGSISRDGRYVAFRSFSNDLVSNFTNVGFDGVFVRDRQNATTELISVTVDGAPANGECFDARLSADGRYVVFESYASNLVTDDTNGTADVFVRDRLAGITERVSVDTTGAGGSDLSDGSAISASGRCVAFQSNASNLVAGDTNTQTDVFVRALDTANAAGDLTGDGDFDDAVLERFDATTATAATFCPAGMVSAAAGAAAFLRPESAGTTPNLASCPGSVGPLVGGKPDLNNDGDATDDVVHYATGGGTVENLQRAASAVSLSGQCAGGANLGQLCVADLDCPDSTCAASWIAALVSEAAQGNADLNGDGDTLDRVVQVHKVGDSPTTWSDVSNVGQAADTVQVAGSLVVFLTPEAGPNAAGQNKVLNGDGDKSDRVLQIYDAVADKLVNTHQAGEEFVVGSTATACAGGPLVAFRTLEAAQGNDDLNGDGDSTDAVLQVYAPSLGVLNTHQAVTPCNLDACDPRRPYRVTGSQVKFITSEADQGHDLNGDNDANDVVLQVFDACTGVTKYVATLDPNASGYDPLDLPADSPVTIAPGARCVETLNSPATCSVDADCPDSAHCEPGGNVCKRVALLPVTCASYSDCPSGMSCENQNIVVAGAAATSHDTAVLTRKAMTISIASGAPSVTKKLKIKVRNADVSPVVEKPGHIIRLSVSDGTCPVGTVVGLPDFDTRPVAPGQQDSVLLAGGKAKTATVPITITSAAFTTFNRKAPLRCTLSVEATTVLAGNVDPTPRNNVIPVELNIIDKNDVEQTTTHESLIKSQAPIKVVIGKHATTATKNVTVKLTNADLGDLAPDAITLGIDADSSDCPAGTVTVTGTNPVVVAGGATGSVIVQINVNDNDFKSANKFSPARCTTVLQAAISGNSEPDPSNNGTRLVIDVDDKTDY
ncbi:MAG TPA: hypothetical protein VMT89_16300 [Candidatus Acidoferrales bacterium]|nr:hypothetical protein [Candidatus Acidoferrales bacterium]